MTINKDRIGALLLLAFAIFYLRQSFKIELDPTATDVLLTSRTLPISLAILAIICSLIQLFIPASWSQDGAAKSMSVRSFIDALNELQWRKVVLLIALMTVYALVFGYLGFVTATFGFLVGGFYILGERRFLLVIAIAGGLIFGMWLLLAQLFGLYLDPGEVFRLLAN